MYQVGVGQKHHDHRPREKAESGSNSAQAAFAIAGLRSDVPELRRARALWQRTRFEESLRLFKVAVRKYPQNRVALIDASRALGARFEIERA